MTTEDPRENSRANVFFMAVLTQGEASGPVRIRNISATGALLDAKHQLPPVGARVRLRRGDLSVSAEIVWRDQGCCGVRFENGIDVEKWVRRVGHAGQRRVDGIVAGLRAGADIPNGDEQPGGLKETLSALGAELTRICEDMANFPGLTEAMCTALVRLDVVAERLRQCAGDD